MFVAGHRMGRFQDCREMVEVVLRMDPDMPSAHTLHKAVQEAAARRSECRSTAERVGILRFRHIYSPSIAYSDLYVRTAVLLPPTRPARESGSSRSRSQVVSGQCGKFPTVTPYLNYCSLRSVSPSTFRRIPPPSSPHRTRSTGISKTVDVHRTSPL